MIVDTSALIAILRREPEGSRFSETLLAGAENRISAGTLLEAQMVALGYGGLGELVLIGAEVVPFDERQVKLALDGLQRFGKGRHKAGLNFGDCFAYALSKALDEPLLFKGKDFTMTDVQRVAYD
jgi:ribonuclease VapC